MKYIAPSTPVPIEIMITKLFLRLTIQLLFIGSSNSTWFPLGDRHVLVKRRTKWQAKRRRAPPFFSSKAGANLFHHTTLKNGRFSGIFPDKTWHSCAVKPAPIFGQGSGQGVQNVSSLSNSSVTKWSMWSVARGIMLRFGFHDGYLCQTGGSIFRTFFFHVGKSRLQVA